LNQRTNINFRWWCRWRRHTSLFRTDLWLLSKASFEGPGVDGNCARHSQGLWSILLIASSCCAVHRNQKSQARRPRWFSRCF